MLEIIANLVSLASAVISLVTAIILLKQTKHSNPWGLKSPQPKRVILLYLKHSDFARAKWNF